MDCTCHMTENENDVGYSYVMCTEHFEEFLALLDEPPVVNENLAALMKQRTPFE